MFTIVTVISYGIPHMSKAAHVEGLSPMFAKHSGYTSFHKYVITIQLLDFLQS